MFKYWRHLGDYAKATGHLTMLEHGAYTMLLDLAYDSEEPLPADETQLFRRVRARTAAEKSAVRAVLNEFWIQAPDGWVNERVQRELADYQAKSEKTRDAAAKRWHSGRNADALHGPSAGNASRARSGNQQPRTSNQSTLEAAPPGELNLAGSSMPDAGEVTASASKGSMDIPAPGSDGEKKEGGGGPPKGGAAGAAARPRNELFDGLAQACGVLPEEVTKALGGEIGTALRDIKRVCADVTVAEIERRAAAYRREWPRATLSPSALAKHWGRFGAGPQKKERAGAAPEPEGWREFITDVLQWTSVPQSWDKLRPEMQREIVEGMKSHE